MNRIKQLRTALGLKQIDLCKKLGVTQGALSGWENERYEPDIDSLKKMSEIFRVPIDEILGNPLRILAEEKYNLAIFEELSPEEQQQLLDNALSEQEQHLIECFRSMNEQGQAYILQTIDMAKEIYKTTNQTGSGSGYRIAAFGAKGTEADDQPPIDENIL